MTDIDQLPSDRALLAATRSGSATAWTELRRRHVDGLVAAARVGGGRRGARRRADEALERLHREILDPGIAAPEIMDGAGEPDPPAAAIRSMRPRAIGVMTGGFYGPTPGGEQPGGEQPGGEQPDGEQSGGEQSGGEQSGGERPGVDAASSGARADSTVDAAERSAVALAFARLPERWQTVLWHRLVEGAPAATVALLLGCRAVEVAPIEDTARRGLFDAYTEVLLSESTTPRPDVMCLAIIPLLGAHRRGTLPAAQQRLVVAHLTGEPERTDGPAGCVACRRRLTLPDRFADVVPAAIVPGLLGVDAARYRAAVGLAAAALGATAIAARRSDRVSRLARAGAVVAIVLAVLAAAFFIREPFGRLDSDFADLLESTTTGSVPATPPSVPATAPPLPSGSANRIELEFPGVPQGAVYVPGGRAMNLSVELSSPAPVFAGATGTIDVGLTNNDTGTATFRFGVRVSPGVTFDRLSEGDGSCGVGTEGTSCSVSLGPGSSTTLSMRFALEAEVPNRLVVASNVGSEPLEVPVAFVSDLLIGQVDRAGLVVIGNSVGSCSVDVCPTGHREASSATLDVGAVGTVDRALLVWEGSEGASWASSVGLILPGSRQAVELRSDAVGGRGIEPDAQGAVESFRSTADVTELVRRAGSGTYTLVRPPSVAESGDGTWTLVVVVSAPASPRRILVVLATPSTVLPQRSVTVSVPIDGSQPPTTERSATLAILGGNESGEPPRVAVDGVELDDPISEPTGDRPGVASIYPLEIPSTRDELSIEASMTAAATRLASIGLVVHIES